MNQITNFSVKAKSEYASEFRRAFEIMGANVNESYEDDNKSVIKFRVTCELGKTDILENEVPLKAYAGVAFSDMG